MSIDVLAGAVRDDGFAVIRGLLSVSEASDIATRVPWESARSGSQPHIGLIRPYPEIVRLAASDRIVALASQVLGCLPYLIGIHAQSASPGAQRQTGWHDDLGHLPGLETRRRDGLMVKICVALTDASDGGQSLELLAGSHRCTGEPSVTVGLGAGDALAFDAASRHRSTYNSGDSPRRSVWFVYAVPWIRELEGFRLSPTAVALVKSMAMERPWVAELFAPSHPYGAGMRTSYGGQLH